MQNNLLINIIELNRNTKIYIQIIVDMCLIFLSFFLSMSIRLNDLRIIFELDNLKILSFLIPISILIYFICGFYQSIIRFVSEKFFLIVGIGIFISSTVMYLGTQLFEIFLPRSVPFIYFYN